jgi:hypothetical protein
MGDLQKGTIDTVHGDWSKEGGNPFPTADFISLSVYISFEIEANSPWALTDPALHPEHSSICIYSNRFLLPIIFRID